MNIKYIKSIFFLAIFSVFLISCDGKDCIEADDFGEYDTDILTVDSKYPACQWDEEKNSGSTEVLNCLENKSGDIVLDQKCTFDMHSKTCLQLKECLDGIGTSCYNDYSVSNLAECEAYKEDGTGSLKKETLRQAYSNCLQMCLDSCLSTYFTNENSFEPNWENNLFKDDKGTLGIKIVPSQTVDIQVLGSVDLVEPLENELYFNNLSSNKLQSDNRYYRENLEPILSGGWCSKKTNNTCTNWIGEENGNSENIQKRYEFLRRGVLVLNNLPNGGVLDENGSYKGPDLFINYGNWKCNYDTTDKSIKCITDYPDSDYKNQNDLNFAMDNDFVKKNGGLVVPVAMNKFILSAPDTNDNSIEASINLPNSSLKNTYLFRDNLVINSLYPIKLAFAIKDIEENKYCNISISQEGYTTSYDFVVKANGNWFFPLKNNKQVVFNKTEYNTLKEDSETNSFDISGLNNFKLVVQSSNCDKNVSVFVMPQNEILMKKSGFVSFKNLLGNFSDYNITFDIINPMYDYQSNNELLNKNFYEYVDANNKPESKTLSIKENMWSNDVFVRKGQILRFDSDSWFNINGNNNDGYTITRRTANVDGNSISIGDSLVLKSEYRPAVLCKGEAEEEIDNPSCTKIYNIETEKYECAKKTYSDICTNENTNYCPLGCYCDIGIVNNDDRPCKNKSNYKSYYIDGADTTSDCIYFEGVNSGTCKRCEEEVKKVNSDLTTTIKTNLLQCYDLENYKGAVRNLLDLSDTQLYSTNVSEYGELTVNDKILKAGKLNNIFSGANYGNFDGMSVDTSYLDQNSREFSKFEYNSPSSINSRDKSISFFVIDNSNFDSDLQNNYNDNNGNYKLTFAPKENFVNGQQLAVVLAMNDWDGDFDSDKFKSWVVKYNINKNNESNYGKLDIASPYIFDSNGYIKGNLDGRTKGDSKIHIDGGRLQGLENIQESDYEKLRLFFKIIDKPEKEKCNGGSTTKVAYVDTLCKCKSGTNSQNYMSCIDLVCDENVETETKEETYCVNSYYNNSGSYTIKLKTQKDVFNSTGYIVKYVMKPILEVLDGKTVALHVNNNGKPIACDSNDSSQCNYYFPQSKFDEYEVRFGNECSSGDNNTKEGVICYQNCSNLDLNLYKTNCKYFNNGGGFLQRFYVTVITDRDYQVIVKLCFTLMIMFYGMYYLMGMAELTYGELIKRMLKIAFIYLMIGTEGWKYYNMFFVKFFKQGVDYLVFAVAGAFDNSPDLMNAFTKGDFYDKSVLFSGVDKNLSLLFSDAVSYKIWGLFFVSFFGWLYVFIIYASILTYIFSVANAMLLYLTAQFFLSILLAMGPIFFVMLIFDKTKEMFNKWISNLISFALEQILLLTCVSLFNILVYNVIKFVLSYRVCWKPIWEINIPLLGSLQLMSFWKATTATSATAAASAVPGLFQILLIYLIADLMNKFIEFSTDLGGNLGGSGMYMKELASDFKKIGQDFYKNRIKEPMKTAVENFGKNTGRKLIGYRTAEDEKKENDASKKARHALRKANREADKDVSQYKKTHYNEMLGMSAQERMDKIADIRKATFVDVFKKEGGESALKDLNLTYKDNDGKEQEISSAQDVFDNRIIDKDLTVSHSLLGLGVQKSGLRSAVGLHNIGSAFQSGIFGKAHKFRTGAFTSAKKVDEKIRLGESDDAEYSHSEKNKTAKNIVDNEKRAVASKYTFGKLNPKYYEDKKGLQKRENITVNIDNMNKENKEQTEKNKPEIENYKDWIDSKKDSGYYFGKFAQLLTFGYFKSEKMKKIERLGLDDYRKEKNNKNNNSNNP